MNQVCWDAVQHWAATERIYMRLADPTWTDLVDTWTGLVTTTYSSYLLQQLAGDHGDPLSTVHSGSVRQQPAAGGSVAAWRQV